MEEFISKDSEISVNNIKARVDSIRKPSGKLSKRLIIDYPEAVAIVPFIAPDKFIVVSQYRYALQKETLEFPAGKIDPGETPEQSVHRELLEETGYTAGSIQKIYTYAPAIGYSTEMIHMFFATDLEKSLKASIDPDEISKYSIFSKKELWEKIEKEDLLDPKLVIGLLTCEKLKLI